MALVALQIPPQDPELGDTDNNTIYTYLQWRLISYTLFKGKNCWTTKVTGPNGFYRPEKRFVDTSFILRYT
jgi:hypothetical protein